MSIASVITGGFGQSVALIITDGYALGAAIAAAAALTGGIGHGGKKARRRYLIKDRLYYLTEDEFQQVIYSLGEEAASEVRKPAKKLVKTVIEVEKPQYDIDGNLFYRVPNQAELRKFALPPDNIMRTAIISAIAHAKQMAEMLAIIDEDDFEVLMLD